MANNYTILSSFGFNVIPSRTAKEAGKVIGEAVEGLWAPVLNYLEQNEDVFSGKTLEDLDKMHAQAMNLGMAMRQGEERHSFSQEF